MAVASHKTKVWALLPTCSEVELLWHCTMQSRFQNEARVSAKMSAKHHSPCLLADNDSSPELGFEIHWLFLPTVTQLQTGRSFYSENFAASFAACHAAPWNRLPSLPPKSEKCKTLCSGNLQLCRFTASQSLQWKGFANRHYKHCPRPGDVPTTWQTAHQSHSILYQRPTLWCCAQRRFDDVHIPNRIQGTIPSPSVLHQKNHKKSDAWADTEPIPAQSKIIQNIQKSLVSALVCFQSTYSDNFSTT